MFRYGEVERSGQRDPITLIVTALGAGAGSALQDETSAAVKDAYARLKALVKKRFAGRPKGELVLAEMRAHRRRGKRRWLRSCPQQTLKATLSCWRRPRR